MIKLSFLEKAISFQDKKSPCLRLCRNRFFGYGSVGHMDGFSGYQEGVYTLSPVMHTWREYEELHSGQVVQNVYGPNLSFKSYKEVEPTLTSQSLISTLVSS